MKISTPAMFLQAFQNGGIQDKKRHMSGKIEVCTIMPKKIVS